MAKEYRNGLGVAYRALEEAAEELEHLWEQGEVRLSQEQIDNKWEALDKLKLFEDRIKTALSNFRTIAPPARPKPITDPNAPEE